MELRVKINDPKMYSQPWMAMNKFVLHRLPDNFDIQEFFCAPSETASTGQSLVIPLDKVRDLFLAHSLLFRGFRAAVFHDTRS